MTPSFNIFKPGTKAEQVDTLIHCFLQRTIFNSSNLPAFIRAPDGIVYKAVYDSRFPAGDFEVIISFQRHTYGSFAIVRLAKEESCSRR